MLFNSLHFLTFFPLVCLIYFLLPTLKARNLFLLAASYYFYMNWEPTYALLLLGSTVVTYTVALGVDHFKERYHRKWCLTGGIVANLSILFFFKYYDFASENLTQLLKICGVAIQMPSFSILLPVGISFYIFQALGYAIDVYRGTTPVERNFFTYALFVSFFPQLVAGPIERSSNLLPQFKCQHSFSNENAMAGLRLMIWGLFLKLVLADRCAIYVDGVYESLSESTGGSYLLAVLVFPFQIYGDFAGYSLTAIGAAKVMGFTLQENFHRPYLATTVTEFWRRWHISLSTWFRDYVYIPLGGNRVSQARCYANIMITFVVSGLWHGANWTYVVWGTMHGAIQCTEKALGWNRNTWRGWKRTLLWALTFVFVCMAWIFFRASTIGDAFMVVHGIFTDMSMPIFSMANAMGIFMGVSLVLIKEYMNEYHASIHISSSRNWLVRHIYIVFMISFILTFGVLNGDQFIYFQF